MIHKPGRTADVILLILLILLPLLFFWRLITPSTVDQMNIVSGDFTEQYFPLRAFAAQEWVQGRIPLWNPYLFGGQPALADIQSGGLYPPHVGQALLLGWGGALLGYQIGFPLEALQWQVILHFSIAAAGAYLFVRQVLLRSRQPLRRARLGAVIASLVFTYGGYLTGFPVQQVTILQVSSWLPWLLWSVDTAVSHRDQSRPARDWGRLLIAIAGGGLLFALAILAGHPQTVLYLFYLSLAYALFLGGRISKIMRALVIWLAIVLLGLAIAAAQLLPTLEFIARSLRADLSYPAVSAGLPLTELVSILYPGFFGGSPEYVGIASLVLIAFALMIGWRGWQHTPVAAHVLFWTAAGLVSLLLAFGNNLFVYPVFYLLAPGFDIVRQQERAFLVYSFSAAMLAGFGAAFLIGPLPRWARSAYRQFRRGVHRVALFMFFVTGLFIYGSSAATARGDTVNLFYGVLRHHLFGLLILAGMIVALWLRDRRRFRRWWGVSLLAVWVGFNLFSVNWRFNLAPPEEVASFTPDGVVRFLQQRVGPSVQNPGGQLGRIVSGGLLPGGNSAASVYELQDLTGNTPLQLAAVDTVFRELPAWRLWQLMNVRYVVDRRDIGDAGLSQRYADGELLVFEMGDPFERAWFVSGTEIIADDGLALARLGAEDFDVRQAAVLAAAPPLNLRGQGAAFNNKIAIKKFSPTHLALTVQTPGPQLLVVSQIYYPGWQAFIDGRPAELLRANVIQQAVSVPGGSHTIDLIFWPASFSWGILMSGLGVLLATGLLLWGCWLTLYRR